MHSRARAQACHGARKLAQGLTAARAGAAAGLAVNQCLSRHEHGARLLQVGEQPLALGAKFRARVVLDITVRPSLPGPWRLAPQPFQAPGISHPCPPRPPA